MSRVTFTETGFEQYKHWQIHNKKTLKKINSLLKSIERDGVMRGEGKPEKLRHKNGEYSRRIDDENRLVYEFNDDQIIVKACKGHYED